MLMRHAADKKLKTGEEGRDYKVSEPTVSTGKLFYESFDMKLKGHDAGCK